MQLIVGGAYQGKTAFARETLGIADIADGASCTPEQAKSAVCISRYHLLVKRLGGDCISFTETLCRVNPDVIILMDEIGCGIIPMEKTERIWREQVGRCGCILAANAETVIRMVCGIPTAIKGDLP